MGFVRVSFGDGGKATVVLHPRNTEAATAKAVANRVADLDVKQVELRHLTADGWVSELTAGGAAASTRIRTLCGIPAEPHTGERWRLTNATPSAPSDETADALRLMQQKWRVSFGNFSESVFSFAMRHGLLGRLILAGAKRREADLVFRYIGEDYATYLSEEFRYNAIGTNVEAQPDKDYGAWVAAAYKAVAVTGQPRYDYIDAYLPESQRGPWIRYERLLLPWTLPTGEVLVSASSRIKSDRMLKQPV
jgi:hypothetical protein